MHILEQIQNSFANFIKTKFNLPHDTQLPINLELNIDRPRAQFGDLNSNIAMLLAKQLKQNPQAIAQLIIIEYQAPNEIEKIEFVAPGFINITLKKSVFVKLLNEINQQKASFFKPSNLKSRKYLIEFVSANPTGPMHLGHGRGAIIGDVLGNVLKFNGHLVTKEFYINDAGNQINKLGLSLKIRCQQALGINIELPEAAYHGEYLRELAHGCIADYGPTILEKPDSFFAHYGKEKLLDAIKHTLLDYGVKFDIWFSEKSLHESQAITQALAQLKLNNYTYEKDQATWFKSTEFGDDKDRVVCKSDGELTYVAADIAYLKNKVDRGAEHLVMILGQDHHSYATRLQGLKQALGLTNLPLDIIIYQLVSMQASGEAVRMSKRAGNIVTLLGVIETVGKDVARFFYLNRKADSQLEFNLDLALTKTEENPVYYIQYALVRIRSILRKAQTLTPEIKFDLTNTESITEYISEPEYLVLKKIIALKDILAAIESTQHTHLLAYYSLELAKLFHAYYGQHKVLDPEQPELSSARLLVLEQLENTLELTLKLMGLDTPESM